jgi:cytochrome c-type biogenesis protein CcsB
MPLLILEVAAVFYLLTALVGALQWRWPRPLGDRAVVIGLGLAASVHAASIAARGLAVSGLPLAHLHDGLSLFGLLAAAIALWVAARRSIPQAATLAAALVGGVVVLAAVIEPPDALPERLRSAWLPLHISLAFLGEAAFAVAGIVALVYLVQERRLKAKKRIAKAGTGVHRLPALELLDLLGVRLVQVGFLAMTLGLVAGAIYGKEVSGLYWTWGLLNIVSVLVWALYALLLHFRITIGWRGKRAAVLTVVGVVATLVAIVGLGLAGVGAHGQDYPS